LQFETKIAYFGMINGLSQALVKSPRRGADFIRVRTVGLRLVDPVADRSISHSSRHVEGFASAEASSLFSAVWSIDGAMDAQTLSDLEGSPVPS
jgi:hypothetical protein